MLGKGNPPLCKIHDKYRQVNENPALQGVLDALLAQPIVKTLFGRAGSVIDSASSVIDTLANGNIDEFLGRINKPKVIFDPEKEKLADARKVLGFSETEAITLATLKDRKIKFARVFHPDTGTGDAEAMKRINEAIDILTKHLKKGAK